MSGPNSSSAVIAHTNTTTMDAWINEVFTGLVTNGGIRQLPAAMDTGQMAVPTTTAYSATTNAAVGYYMLCFTDPLALGPLNLVALSALTAGTGYNGGTAHTFTGVALSGGLGSGAIGTVVLGAAGIVSSITITTAGTGYSIGDQLTVTSANIVAAGGAAGGGSSGFGFVASLASTVPTAVIKLEFGTGTTALGPQMFATVGTSWASNGTLGALTCGAVSTRGALCIGTAPVSTATLYTSRFNYNNVLGYLGFSFKLNGVSANINLGTLIISRSNDTGGNPTGESLNIYVNNFSAVGTNNGTLTCSQANMIYATNSMAVNTAPSAWLASLGQPMPFNDSSTLLNGNGFMIPGYYKKPAVSISAYIGAALLSEVPPGNSISASVIGATPLTFISIGGPFGSSGIGGASIGTQTFMMLWQ